MRILWTDPGNGLVDVDEKIDLISNWPHNTMIDFLIIQF